MDLLSHITIAFFKCLLTIVWEYNARECSEEHTGESHTTTFRVCSAHQTYTESASTH